MHPQKNKVRSVLTKPQVKPIPFTAIAFAELKSTYAVLTKKKAAVMARLKVAREMGDLSENGAYTYAKFELGSINRQLRQTKHLLSYGVVASATQKDHVDFGSVVTVSLEGKQYTYTLVSVHESDPQKGKLSIESPIGKAFLSKKVGDIVTITTPSGKKEYTIFKIDFA